MGMRLTLPPQHRDRFEFVFHISQSADGETVVCRAEIFERSNLKATLQIASKNQSRLEVADAVLERCIRWADLRIKEDFLTSGWAHTDSNRGRQELNLPRWPS